MASKLTYTITLNLANDYQRRNWKIYVETELEKFVTSENARMNKKHLGNSLTLKKHGYS